MPKIVHERFKCIGCGACAALCPKFWRMDKDGKSTLIGGKNTGKDIFELEVNDIACNQDASDACPVNCIHVK